MKSIWLATILAGATGLSVGCAGNNATAPLPPAATAAQQTATEAATTPAKATEAASITEAMLLNMTYVITGIDGKDLRVTVTNGAFDGTLPGSDYPSNAKVFKTLLGDLDGDGAQDGIALVAYNAGGSGVFSYLEAVVLKNGVPTSVANAFLGDRTGIDRFEVKDGVVTLDVVAQGPNDPMCCPTSKETWTYALQNGAWVQTSKGPTP